MASISDVLHYGSLIYQKLVVRLEYALNYPLTSDSRKKIAMLILENYYKGNLGNTIDYFSDLIGHHNLSKGEVHELAKDLTQTVFQRTVKNTDWGKPKSMEKYTAKVARNLVKELKRSQDFLSYHQVTLYSDRRFNGSFNDPDANLESQNPLTTMKKDALGFVAALSDNSVPLEVRLETQQRVETLKRYLELLPAHQRKALEMHYIDELPYMEISEKLGRPINTVKSDIRRAKSLIQEKFQNRAE